MIQEWKVQTEEDFEDMCEYLDDTQIHTLQVELRSSKRRRPEGTADGGSNSNGGGVNTASGISPPKHASPLSPANQAQVPRDRLAVRKSQSRLPVRPSTAGARRIGGANPLLGGQRPKATYGALGSEKRGAWGASAGGLDRGPASPRVRRQARPIQGNMDKESMQDRIIGLQRQLNQHEEDKTRLQAETVRLELELAKVLRENEELFKAKGGSSSLKGGASSNLVYLMKKRIKELEGAVNGKDSDMKKLKSDTRVTRLNEMEVEKNTYLHEVRRLQRESRQLREQLQLKESMVKEMAGAQDEGANYRKLYSMYEQLSREHEEAKRRVREVQMASLASTEDRKQLEAMVEKLRAQLAQAKGKAQRATAAAAAAKTGGVVKGDARVFGDKERETATEKIKELVAMQKRLDLALNRSNRERDTAEQERAEKEAEVLRLQEQKRALQMQLHSLGTDGSDRGRAPATAGGRSDMICFFIRDADLSHVEVQFVDFRMTFGEFSEIVNRLYRRTGALSFTYQWQGQEVVVSTATDFARCKETIEDAYNGVGDQAIVVTLGQSGGAANLHSDGVPDGGSAARTAPMMMGQAPTPLTSKLAPAEEDESPRDALVPPSLQQQPLPVTQTKTTSPEPTAAMSGRSSAASSPTPKPPTPPLPVLGDDQDEIVLCCFLGEADLGELRIARSETWESLRSRLRQMVGEDAFFSFPHPADEGRTINVRGESDLRACLALILDNDGPTTLDVDLVRDSARAAPAAGSPGCGQRAASEAAAAEAESRRREEDEAAARRIAEAEERRRAEEAAAREQAEAEARAQAEAEARARAKVEADEVKAEELARQEAEEERLRKEKQVAEMEQREREEAVAKREEEERQLREESAAAARAAEEALAAAEAEAEALAQAEAEAESEANDVGATEGDGGEGEYDQDFEDDFEREDEDSGADGQRGSGSGGVNSAEGADDVGEDNGFEQVEVSASDGGSGGIVDDYGDDDFDVASGGGGGNSFGGSPEDDDGLIEDDLASDNEDDF